MRYISWLQLFMLGQRAIDFSAAATTVHDSSSDGDIPLADADFTAEDTSDAANTAHDLVNKQRRSIAEDYLSAQVDLLFSTKRISSSTAQEMKSLGTEAIEAAYSMYKLDLINRGDKPLPELLDINMPLDNPRPPIRRPHKKSPAKKK